MQVPARALAGWIAGCVALAGCDRPEPSFDDRYVAAQKAVASQAATIDAELAERERERADAAAVLAADPAAAPATPAGPPPGTAPAAE